MSRITTIAFALGLLASGCHVGNVDLSQPRPSGAVARIVLRSGEFFPGELLAVHDSGFVVLRADQVAFVAWAAMRKVEFSFPALTLSGGRAPDEDQRQALTQVSRYPQGVTPEIEVRLLAAHHQTSVVAIGP